jgi:hypothetical protein
LNGAMPLPFGWPLAHPQALLATAAPAMAMVGALRRERPQAVYAPARLRRSGSVPRPFRAAMRLGEFHVRVLEPGHPSEKRAVEYTPAALPETGPRKRRRPVEAEVPVEAGAAAAASGAAAPDRTENELRRKLVEAAAAEPLTTRILDRLRELWEDAPRLARAGVLAIPALVAALLYFQGSETNVAAGGGVAETTRPTAAPPPTPVETAPAAAKATPAAAPVAAAPEAPGTAPLPSDVPPSVADKPPGGFSLASLQYAIRRRATVYVDEDFRSGLLRWSGEEGWDKTWAIDRTYLATPGKLALLEPTLKLENYRFEFLGQVGKKSLSFVFRAKDEDNYHAGRINLIAPRGAPNGRISLTRWMVIDGEEQNKKEIPLPGTVELDAMYRVLVTIQGGHFTLHVNGQMADYWDDDRLAWGGIGFFNEKGAVSKLLWAKVIDNDDFLGNVCSLLSPKTADRKTLNRDRSGKDSASR